MSKERAHDLEGILFDWDGTIIDSAQAMWESYRYAYQKHLGIVFPQNDDEFRLLVEMRVAESAARFAGQHAADVTESYNWYYREEAYKTSKPFPGVLETLAELRRKGYQVGVASNKSWERIETEINYLQLDGLVGIFVTAEDTRERKPHAAPLLKLAEKMGLAAHRCAYIGDYQGDIIAAKSAGMVSVAVLWGGIFLHDALIAENPDYVVTRPEALLDIFPGATLSQEGLEK
jgi:HAD superfamily hydrolase (TIGR01662 family)